MSAPQREPLFSHTPFQVGHETAINEERKNEQVGKIEDKTCTEEEREAAKCIFTNIQRDVRVMYLATESIQ